MEIFHTLCSMTAVRNLKQNVDSIFMELIHKFYMDFFSFHNREEEEDFYFSAIATVHLQQHAF